MAGCCLNELLCPYEPEDYAAFLDGSWQSEDHDAMRWNGMVPSSEERQHLVGLVADDTDP